MWIRMWRWNMGIKIIVQGLRGEQLNDLIGAHVYHLWIRSSSDSVGSMEMSSLLANSILTVLLQWSNQICLTDRVTIRPGWLQPNKKRVVRWKSSPAYRGWGGLESILTLPCTLPCLLTLGQGCGVHVCSTEAIASIQTAPGSWTVC